MAFVDELRIHARGGKGGDGVVRWLHEKGKEFSGPSGGNGGRGGAIYMRAVRDSQILNRYTGEKEFRGEDGGDGMSRKMHGKDGKDITIDVPVGSVITNLETKEQFDLSDEGQSVMILSGGRGGVGNHHYKSSVNRSPIQFTEGQSGQEADLHIELRLVADVGLIGLPNAGKSSLLNVLTNAAAKVGAYAFTTLDPNLGAFYGYIIADIPGLIEGAAGGKGLGHKFLRHITRTKVLIHCISLESEDPMRDYKVVREELLKFSDSLKDKREIIMLTKVDSVTPARLKEVAALFKKLKLEILSVTILDDESIKSLRDALILRLRKE